jgi:UDP-glucose 4-epimerase
MRKDSEVVVADVRPPRTRGLQFIKCDVREPSEVRRALSGATVALYFSVVQIPQINTEKRLGFDVNILGLQNVCEAGLKSSSLKGVILSGTWHVFGERGITGVVDESFGFRPDKVEERARIYALCKIVQETLMRLYDELGSQSGKTYGVIRMGTVLGEGMPEPTAASLFIRCGLKGEPLTPYNNSIHRPMLYVDILDICKAYDNFAKRITDGKLSKQTPQLPHIVNVVWPEPITILDLAELVKKVIKEKTKGRVDPLIQVKDTGLPAAFSPDDKSKFRIDSTKALSLLNMSTLTSPRDSIVRIVESYLSAQDR